MGTGEHTPCRGTIWEKVRFGWGCMLRTQPQPTQPLTLAMRGLCPPRPPTQPFLIPNPNLSLTCGLGRVRSLVLYGETRTGKTVWARSLGRHGYSAGLFNLAEHIASDHEYNVFDDIAGGAKFFPQYKQWLGCQSNFTSSDKYTKKVLIRGGLPAIWIGNTDPRLEGVWDNDWLEGNCTFIDVGSDSIVIV